MPADLLTQIQTYSAQLDAAAPPVERLMPEAADVGRLRAPAGSPLRPKRKLVVALAAAVLALVGIGLIPLLFRSSGEAEPANIVDEVINGLNELTTADIPPVRLRVAFDHGFDSTGELKPGEGIAEITYIPEAGYRLDIVEGTEDAPAGSYFIWDGTQSGFFKNDSDDEGPLGFRLEESSPVYPPNWQTDFSDLCRPRFTDLLGDDVVAGRRVVGLHCAPLAGEWSVWVDEETGLVLRLEGRHGVGGEVGMVTSTEGRIEVVDVTFDPEISNAEFDVSGLPSPDAQQAPAPDLPPFRALISRSITTDEVGGEMGTFATLIEVWYRAPEAWRVDLVEGTGPHVGMLEPGSYWVQVGNTYAQFDAEGYETFVEEGLVPGFPVQADQMVGRIVNGVYPSCGAAEDGARLGRPVEIYECTIPGTDDPLGLALDVETGLVLLETWSGEIEGSATFEVIELEIDPVFPPSLIQLPDPPEGPPPYPLLGRPAPGLTAPLLDGTPFDLADLRGRSTAVLFWASWCQPCLDAMEEFQAAANLLGEDIAFVAPAVSDQIVEVSGVVARGGLTVSMPLFEHGNAVFKAWQLPGIPSLVLVDASGTIVDFNVGSEIMGNVVEILLDADW